MISLDLPPLWTPSKPAIIRPSQAEQAIFPGLAPLQVRPGGSVISILQRLGLTTNLRLALDAGDKASYDPSVQTAKWLDLSGGGYDFYRGTSAAGDAAEPTFNGTAGKLSSAEYWSVDGGDYFTYDSANETWMQVHKNNSNWTFVALFYRVSTTALALFGTGGSGNGPGIILLVLSNGIITVQHKNGLTTQNLNSTITVPLNVWNMIGVSLAEPAGVGGSFFFLNNSIETFNGTYSSPSASNAAFTMQVLAEGNNVAPPASGSRCAIVCMWDRALSQSEMTAFFIILYFPYPTWYGRSGER
jgi:hypothetical protein